MKRRKAIATLAGAVGLKATDLSLEELNPNGVYVLIVPKSMGTNVVMNVGKVWERMWKHIPVEKRPMVTLMTDDMKIANLKDIL